jgi:hypothetical protein
MVCSWAQNLAALTAPQRAEQLVLTMVALWAWRMDGLLMEWMSAVKTAELLVG